MRLAWRNKRGQSGLAVSPLVDRLGRILILSLTFWCLALGAAVWWYYTVQKRATEAATLRGIFAVAAEKTSQVANWRSERMGDGHVVMSSPVMRTARRALSSGTVADADRADLVDLMHRLAAAFQYTDVSLVDLDGNVRVRLREDLTDGPQFGKSAREQLARQANSANDVILSDLTMETRTRAPLMSLTVPVHDLGAFILEIDPSRFLYPYLKAWPGSNRTAECVLARREGNEIVYLNRRRSAAGMTMFSRRPLNLKPPPDSVLDSGWSLETLDYRDVPIIAAIRRIPDSPWLLICKMDIAEVDAPLRRLGWEMVLITVLIGLANVAGAEMIWRGQQTRIHRDREAWFYALANDTPAYLWMASAGAENSFINRPFQQFLGAGQQVLANTWADYLHPDDAGPVRARFLEAMAHVRGSTDEFRVRRFDGEYRTVAGEAVPRFSSAGQFLGYAGSIVDITGRRRAEEQLRAANARLEAELAERIRKEQEIQTLSARLMGAREEERTRLARELHDGLNQQIAAVSIAIGNLKRHLPAEQVEARGQSDRIHQKLVQLAESVRQMSHELHPAILEYQGLTAALRACCDEFAALTRIRVLFKTEGLFEGVPPSTALCVYRITQEALQNITKHAHAAEAHVEIGHSGGVLRLAVSDNGAGMEPAGVEAKTGLGLLSIKERARLCGGKVEISSELHKGTCVTVTIPL